jgi:hypothetical protein
MPLPSATRWRTGGEHLGNPARSVREPLPTLTELPLLHQPQLVGLRGHPPACQRDRVCCPIEGGLVGPKQRNLRVSAKSGGGHSLE